MTSDSLPESLYIFYFDVTADLAHFRDIFTQSFFKTLLAPPRTTVLGMLGASLGYNEADTINRLSSVYVGVNILSVNGYAKDIMMAINQKKADAGGRTPVMRTLLVKPLYRIFIGSEDERFIEEIREGLLAPTYPLYLGISDCLAYIKDISKVSRVNAKNSNRFSCIVPYDGTPYSYYSKDNDKIIFIPEIVKTVHSFDITKKGKKPRRYIDLLMFYNCEVELKKSIIAYDVGESICMI